jgi:hypothetical protein
LFSPADYYELRETLAKNVFQTHHLERSDSDGAMQAKPAELTPVIGAPSPANLPGWASTHSDAIELLPALTGLCAFFEALSIAVIDRGRSKSFCTRCLAVLDVVEDKPTQQSHLDSKPGGSISRHYLRKRVVPAQYHRVARQPHLKQEAKDTRR